MDMTLKEVIAALTKIQEIAGENCSTNIRHLRLRIGTTPKYDQHYNYRENPMRDTEFSVWADAYADGPQPAPAE